MKLVYKENIVVNAYGARSDKHGFAMFLIFLNGQWIWKNAKHFEPYIKHVDDNDKSCNNCRNNAEFSPPHTCDFCTSLDAEEDNEMWEAIV